MLYDKYKILLNDFLNVILHTRSSWSGLYGIIKIWLLVLVSKQSIYFLPWSRSPMRKLEKEQFYHPPTLQISKFWYNWWQQHFRPFCPLFKDVFWKCQNHVFLSSLDWISFSDRLVVFCSIVSILIKAGINLLSWCKSNHDWSGGQSR